MFAKKVDHSVLKVSPLKSCSPGFSCVRQSDFFENAIYLFIISLESKLNLEQTKVTSFVVMLRMHVC